MAILEDLSRDEAARSVDRAVGQRAVLVVLLREANRWRSFRSRLLSAEGPYLWIAQPQPQESGWPGRVPAGAEIGATFRLGHQKYVFSAAVEEEGFVEADGKVAAAWRLSGPRQPARLVRAGGRTELPSTEIVRAAFWLGGRSAQPAGPSPARPTWSGRVMNIDANGCLVRTEGSAADFLDPGDTVGVRLLSAKEGVAVLDAQVRHAEREGDMAQVGLQFV